MKDRRKTLFWQCSFSRRVLFSFCISFLSIALCSSAKGNGLQERQEKSKTITGMVIAESNGEEIIGAVVRAHNASRNVAVTNEKGYFTIEVAENDTITVSCLGFIPMDVAVGDKRYISVAIREDIHLLDELVVVGYGEQKRKDLTGSVGIVNLETMAKAPVLTFDQALQGRTAGVVISSNDGQPGENLNIVIRGANSLTQSNSPLYVIDGFPIDNFSPTSLNPSDITSINILKDASASAIYGSRGANGVIIVETRQGKAGKPKIVYNGTAGFQQVSKKMDLMRPYDYVSYMLEMFPESAPTYLNNQNMSLEDYKHVKGIDWQELLFRSAPIQTHSVSLSGGTAQTRYATSASYSGQEGIIKNSGYDRLQGRFSFNQVINTRASFSVNMNYTSEKTFGSIASLPATSNNAYLSYLMFRVWTYRPILLGGLSVEDVLDDTSSLGLLNPIKSNENEFNETKGSTFQSNAKFTLEIIDNLKLNVRGAYYNRNRALNKFNNKYTYAGFPSINNSNGVNASFSNIKMTQVLNENTLDYSRDFGRKHSVSVLGGTTLQKTISETYGYGVIRIPYEALGMSGISKGTPSTLTSSPSEYTLLSYLARFNYNFNSKYLFTMSFRADGSSKFAKGNRWGYFPSSAFAWRLKKEKFLKDVKVLSDAKLRISWGKTGNNAVGSYVSYGALNLTDYYSFDNATPTPGVGIISLRNPDLKWETTDQLDIGGDLSLFKERIKITVDVYRKTTTDLLLRARMPYSTGVPTAFRNVGKVQNQGLEFTLSTININTRNFSWSSDFNISFNKSKVLELSDNQKYLLSTVNFTGDYNNSALYITRVGGPITAFYGFVHEGVYQLSDFENVSGAYVLKPSLPTNGAARESIKPGDIKYTDQNKDGIINDHDRVVLGRAEPIHTGGLNNNFRYRNFDLNLFFQWSYGANIMNANRIMLEGNAVGFNLNQFASYVDRWSLDNQGSKNFRAGGQGPRGFYSSRTLEDASYIRLKSLQLSYRFPKKHLSAFKIEMLKLFVSGQNLITFTNYSGLDPEISTRNSALTPGFDYSSYARNRIFTAGVQVNF